MRAEKISQTLYDECENLRKTKYYTDSECRNYCEKRLRSAIDTGLYVVLDSHVVRITKVNVWESLISRYVIVLLTDIDKKEYRLSISLSDSNYIPTTRGLYAIN